MSNRFLVITELFLPTKGGTAVWFDEVYRRLGGKEIHIVTAAVPGGPEHDAQHPNTVHRLDLRRVPWLRPESLGMYAKLFFTSLFLALRHRFDAIHAGRALPEGLVAWVVARLTGRRVVIYAHGEELTGWGRGNKYRAMGFALRHADRVIANSGFTRDTLEGMGVRPERIVIIHPGVDAQRFRCGLPSSDLRESLGLSEGTRLLLSVGRLQRRKGFDTVIRSLPVLLTAGHDVHYAIVGSGEDRAYLDNLAQEVGVAERVHFLGHVSMDDLPRWYNACDFFVLANRDIQGDTEGFGIVFLEAAACGKAALAGTAGGTGSAVLDGLTGQRVDGENLAQLVSTISQWLSEPRMLERLGAAALARVHKELTWERVAERTQEQLTQPPGQA
ncbi:MAG: glycosyltransferase family 4 protein [Rhodocyclaceae bacterium]|jgi:phosphatidylinositol alpha-1,6-mannosyltransferase|nr:glycosyltransferase family 4 protein [Rhodocyclaceae bacterium]